MGLLPTHSRVAIILDRLRRDTDGPALLVDGSRIAERQSPRGRVDHSSGAAPHSDLGVSRFPRYRGEVRVGTELQQRVHDALAGIQAADRKIAFRAPSA